MIRGVFLVIVMVYVFAATAAASEWTVNYTASRLGFEAKQGGSVFSGRFERFTADITFDPNDLSTAVIDVAIDMASARTGAADKDGAMPGADWFNVAEHPTATFRSDSVRATGENAYEADGTLTIRGNSQPLTLPFTLLIDGTRANANGRVTIDRRDFGVGGGVTDEGIASYAVDVIVDIDATR